MMHEFGLVVKAIDFMTVLRDGGAGDNLVQVHAQGCVDVVNKGFHVLL
jgi:hypothetical protein